MMNLNQDPNQTADVSTPKLSVCKLILGTYISVIEKSTTENISINHEKVNDTPFDVESLF
ncbi:MAG: hypothetical protein OXE55_02695 [Flavobacteriaceae bacterium]|nr:hypothetical protein [Flavobacteriaceae bacterium]